MIWPSFRRETDSGIDRPHERDEFVVDDLDDLLAGVDGAQDGLTDGALGDARDEGLDDLEVHVGVEQRLADLLEALLDVRLGDATTTAQLLERIAQTSL